MRSVVQVLSFDVVSKFALALLGIILIRFMPERELATYTLAASVAAIATQTLSGSFNRIFIVGSRRLDFEDISSFLAFELIVIASAVLLTVPFRQFVDGVYWAVVAVVVANCLTEFTRTVYQKDLAFLRLSLVELARALAVLGSLVVLVRVEGFGLKAADVLLVQAGVVFLLFVAVFGKRVRLTGLRRLNWATGLVRRVLGEEYRYLFGYFFVLAFFSQVDVLMLRTMADSSALATYGAAFRYYNLLLLALGAVHIVLLPLVQNARSLAELQEIFGRHARLVAVFIPLTAAAGWLSQWLFPWIDLGKYPEAVRVFRILAISAVISFAFSPHANVVMRFEDFRFLFVLIMLGLLLNAGLNAVLIPPLGATGAAIATLMAFGAVNGAIYLRARKHVTALAGAGEGAEEVWAGGRSTDQGL